MKALIFIVALILTGCASTEGETYRRDYYVLEYSHTYGERPKISANLPNNMSLRAKGYYDGSGGEKIIFLQWKVPLDAYMLVPVKSRAAEIKAKDQQAANQVK